MAQILRTVMQLLLITAGISMFASLSQAESKGDSLPSGSTGDSGLVADHVRIESAWIRPTAPGQTVSGAFMTLVNPSTQDVTLAAVDFSAASVVEIHETSMKDGVMRMRKIDHLDIPANGTAKLQPGSFHIMLIGLEKGLEPGTRETLTLLFSDGSQKAVDVIVGNGSEKQP